MSMTYTIIYQNTVNASQTWSDSFQGRSATYQIGAGGNVRAHVLNQNQIQNLNIGVTIGPHMMPATSIRYDGNQWTLFPQLSVFHLKVQQTHNSTIVTLSNP